MPGLGPGIHVLLCVKISQDVDGRDKRGQADDVAEQQVSEFSPIDGPLAYGG